MDDSGPIPITDPGTKVTDPLLTHSLWAIAPRSLRMAQKLLVITEKAVHGKGFLSTAESRRRKVYEHLYRLERALHHEGCGQAAPYAATSSFLARFAQAYPNWQAEYRFLNQCLNKLL